MMYQKSRAKALLRTEKLLSPMCMPPWSMLAAVEPDSRCGRGVSRRIAVVGEGRRADPSRGAAADRREAPIPSQSRSNMAKPATSGGFPVVQSLISRHRSTQNPIAL